MQVLKGYSNGWLEIKATVDLRLSTNPTNHWVDVYELKPRCEKYCDDRAGRIHTSNVRQLRRSRRRGHKHRSDPPGCIRATGTAFCGALLASFIRRLAYPKFHSERAGFVSDREPNSRINCRPSRVMNRINLTDGPTAWIRSGHTLTTAR